MQTIHLSSFSGQLKYNLNSHKGGHQLYLKAMLKGRGFNAVDFDSNSKISSNDAIFLTEGVAEIHMTSGVFNARGGINEHHYDILSALIICDTVYVEYEHSIKMYNQFIARLIRKHSEFGLSDMNHINFKVLPQKYHSKLVLGDSHSLSVWHPGADLKRIDGTTLYRFVNSSMLEELSSGYDALRFYAGNIDIRYHMYRQQSTYDQIKSLVVQICDKIESVRFSKGVELVEPLPLETYECRKSYAYKGQVSWGPIEKRYEYYTILEHIMRNEAISRGFTTIAWPESFYNSDGLLNDAHLAIQRDVHLRPSKYPHIQEILEKCSS